MLDLSQHPPPSLVALRAPLAMDFEPGERAERRLSDPDPQGAATDQ
jgi:hypothetical protein